jgi:hypothetical protein
VCAQVIVVNGSVCMGACDALYGWMCVCVCVCVFSQLPIVAIMGKKKRRKNDEGGEGGETSTEEVVEGKKRREEKRKEGKDRKTKLISFLVR